MVLALPWLFCTALRTNSDFCFIQHWLTGFYNRGGKCLLRGTDWFLIQSRFRLVFKRLKKKGLPALITKWKCQLFMMYFTTIPVNQIVGISIKSNVLPVHHTMQAWVGPKAGSEHFKNEKKFSPCRNSKPEQTDPHPSYYADSITRIPLSCVKDSGEIGAVSHKY
jgi:hypothetical protein